jgi:hypothetical protein
MRKFLWELIHAKTGGLESAIEPCPFQRWLAIHAMRPDGTFIDWDALAQLFAKLKYIVKNISMVERHSRQASHPNGIIG